jgi:hypothetical protein
MGFEEVGRIGTVKSACKIAVATLGIDPGRITGRQEVIGIGEFLTPLDPETGYQILAQLGCDRVPDNYLRCRGW